MGVPQQMGSLWQNPQVFILGAQPICDKLPGLSEGQQKLCMLYQDHMWSVGRGGDWGEWGKERGWGVQKDEDSFYKFIMSNKHQELNSNLWSQIKNFNLVFSHNDLHHFVLNHIGLYEIVILLHRNVFLSACPPLYRCSARYQRVQVAISSAQMELHHRSRRLRFWAHAQTRWVCLTGFVIWWIYEWVSEWNRLSRLPNSIQFIIVQSESRMAGKNRCDRDDKDEPPLARFCQYNSQYAYETFLFALFFC